MLANRFNVVQHLDNLAQFKGYPKSIRTDNGPEFVSKTFKIWAIKNEYIQPGKPAQNPYIERFNRTYREDVLDINLNITNNLLKIYNEERPHESLGNLTPRNYYELNCCN